MNQRNQEFSRRLDAIQGLPYEVRRQASSIFTDLFLSQTMSGNFDLPDQATHEQKVAMAIDQADKSRWPDEDPEHTVQAWGLVHQFLRDEAIIDHDRFNAIEAVRTNSDGRHDEIMSHFITTGRPGSYTAFPNLANPPTLPPGVQLLNERIESLNQKQSEQMLTVSAMKLFVGYEETG